MLVHTGNQCEMPPVQMLVVGVLARHQQLAS